jgi:formamidopyrimidine-DNA glycosylase
MIEIPESKTLSLQANKALKGRKVVKVFPPTHTHKLAWFEGDPKDYPKLLEGRMVESVNGHGMFVDIHFDGDVSLSVSDGTNLRLFPNVEEAPVKHQLLLVFDDGTCLVFTVAMYGGIMAYKGCLNNKYHIGSLKAISPLDDSFDEDHFKGILYSAKDLSAKALLATQQRIPGLGNGVLQDILFNAGIHPKRKKSSLSESEKISLFKSLKTTLMKMAEQGGRDTEKDLYGNIGGYKTILSKNTLESPCPNCGGKIEKESYMGGAVYFCPKCQKL